MRIRIIGSCGSGKSTLAKELSDKYGIPSYELDNLIWDRSAENLRYPESVRDELIQSIVSSEAWIIEGVQCKDWTIKSIQEADLIFVLAPNVFIRDYRIIKRIVLSRVGLRPWNYKQSFKNLCKMIVKWNHQYNIEEVICTINKNRKTATITKNKKQAIQLIEHHLEVVVSESEKNLEVIKVIERGDTVVNIKIQPVTRENWEEALKISLYEHQLSLVPSVIEGIAYAYIKPWDEAFDPYVLEIDGKVFGFFYLSYTPDSTDNYWIGGFQIDKSYQGKGMGKRAIRAILDYITKQHPVCKVISLTVESDNEIAQNLYKSMSFISENRTNSDDEVIYRLAIE